MMRPVSYSLMLSGFHIHLTLCYSILLGPLPTPSESQPQHYSLPAFCPHYGYQDLALAIPDIPH